MTTSSSMMSATSGGTGGSIPGQTCGNAVKEGTEECDDGNMVHCDGCFHTCETGQVFLELGGFDKNTNELLIRARNCVDIYGFDFHVTGVSVTKASGGTAAQNGWSVAANMSGHVLGFHPLLSPLPAMNGMPQVITKLTIVPPPPNGMTEVCIIDDSSLVMSDMGGQPIEAAADGCIKI